MKLLTEKDELLRPYLLDEMSDEERNAIEEKFLADDDFFDELAAVEDELYYDYKQGTLSTKEKIAFEQKFLSTAQDLLKADFTEAFLQATEEVATKKTTEGFWQSISAFFNFSNANFRLGAALASVLLLLGIGFWVLKNVNREPIVVELPKEINTELPTPTPIDENLIKEKQKEQEELEKKLAEEKQKSEQDANKIKEIEKQKEKVEKEIEANKPKNVTPQTPQKTFIALVLSPGLVRGNGSNTAKIKLTPEIKTVNLTLPIKKDFQNEDFKIVVRNIDSGAAIISSTAKKGKKTSVYLGVPAKNLPRGAYEVVLISSADNEELDSYYFNVEK